MSNSGTNRPLTLPLINQAFVRAQSNGGGGAPSLIASNYVLALKYADLLQPDRRFGGEQMTLDGGFQALKYTGPGGTAAWLMDRMVRRYEIQFIHEADIKQYILDPLNWVNEDGEILKWVSGYDQFDAYMAEYAQYCAERCNRHTSLKDISES